jgi:hypothetical protein
MGVPIGNSVCGARRGTFTRLEGHMEVLTATVGKEAEISGKTGKKWKCKQIVNKIRRGLTLLKFGLIRPLSARSIIPHLFDFVNRQMSQKIRLIFVQSAE